MNASFSNHMKTPMAVALVSGLLLGVSPVWAAKKKSPTSTRSASTLETYSAEDPDPMETSASAITIPAGEAAGTAAPEIAESERATPPSSGNVRSGLTVPPPAVSTRWQTATFDSVPQAQADGVAKRLKLVEEIVRRYGRAYDYRSLTSKDLELILAELDAKADGALQSGNATK
jgi:hypothetical protein